MDRNTFLSRFIGTTACLVFALIVASCMTSPQHEQRIASATEPLYFGGYWASSNETVEIQAFSNRDGTWDTFASATSTGDVQTDPKGGAWYPWQTTVSIPSDPKYWWHVGEGSNRERRINVHARSSSSGIVLTTFDVGAENCQVAALQEGLSGTEVMSRCGRATNDAWVYVACGDEGEAACTAENVEAGDVCNGGLVNRDGACRVPPPIIPPRPPTGGGGGSCDASKVGTDCTVDLGNTCSTGVKSVAGKFECVSGRLQCKQVQKYCKFGDTGPVTERCGASVGQSCQYDEQCVPGAVCDQSTGACSSWNRSTNTDICNGRTKQNYCWLPWTDDNNKPPGSNNHDICL